MIKIQNLYRQIPIELLFFSIGLLLLYFINPNKTHASICPLTNLGFDFCPGCGFGRSLYFLMHFQFSKSWAIHPLGFLGFAVITFRIYTLTRNIFNQKLQTEKS